MDQRTMVSTLAGAAGKEVTLYGWVDVVRDQKAVQFIVLRDESGKVQLVNDRDASAGIAETIAGLTLDSTVRAIGTVELNDRVKLGGLEVRLASLEVLSSAAPALPLNAESALDTRLDWRFVDLRRPENRLIFEIQTAVEQSFRRTWQADGFLELHSPKLMAGASESGAELFRVDYFDTSAYLAQSPQFYKQMAMAAGFGRVFEIGPVFRANPSFTSRHDTEFTSVDVEISWVESHEDVMAFEERLVANMLADVSGVFGERIRETFGTEVRVPTVPFPRISLADALQAIRARGYEVRREAGDLDPEGERQLAAYIQETAGHEFVFVTDYPVSVRPFYHMRQAGNPELTKSFDLLWKGLEITTGAQREHRPEQLVSQVREKGIPEEGLAYYLDFFRYGCPPHGGFGLGLTRVLMILLGMANVREVTFLYRGPNRLFP